MNLVFSYGTLIDKFPRYKKEKAVLIDYFALGTYGEFPALFLDDKEHSIKGYIIALNDKEFKEADIYEGYPHLYDRVQRKFIVNGEEVIAWVYIFNETY